MTIFGENIHLEKFHPYIDIGPKICTNNWPKRFVKDEKTDLDSWTRHE